jgi:hypothetical protein
MAATKKRAPNKSVEEPLVNVARRLARGNRGRFVRLQVVDGMTNELHGLQRRARRQVVQAIISRLVVAGFFRTTRQRGVLRFKSMSALLPWDANVQRKRAAAVKHIRNRLSTIAQLTQDSSRADASRDAIRRNLVSRLRRLEALVGTL